MKNDDDDIAIPANIVCCVTGAGRTVLPKIQRDLKFLQAKPSPSNQPGEEPDCQPPAKRKKIDLIFRDVLQASLEDSGKTWPCFTNSECKTVWKGGTNIPGLKEEVDQGEVEEERVTSAEPSTSFCPNCVKLKRRILELEDELTRLRGEQRDGLAMSEKNPTWNDQSPPHPEQAPIEDFQGMLFKIRGAPSLPSSSNVWLKKKKLSPT